MNKLKMPKTKGNEFHICICETCEDHFEASWNDFMKHCEEKHGVKKGDEGKKEMLMHLDGRDFYEWRYTCNFGDKVKFTEYSRNKRVGEDAEIWKRGG